MGYYLMPRRNIALKWWSNKALLFLLAIALFVRLLPAALLSKGAEYDIESFRRVAEAFLQGQGIYSSPLVSGRHPYLPFQLYLIAMAMWISQRTGLPFAVTVKWPAILADLGLTALMFRTVQRTDKLGTQATAIGLLYALNPVSILVSAYHGQFDAIPTLFLALSWYFWHFYADWQRQIGLSALCLGFAILDKTWPILFLPIVLLRLNPLTARLRYGSVALSVPAIFTGAYIALFPEDVSPLFSRALTHTGVPGWWGASALLNVLSAETDWGKELLDFLARYGRWFIFGAVGTSYWLTRRQQAIDALVTAILTLYVFTSGFGLQWMLWVVPFALLVGDWGAADQYVAGALIYMLPSYYGYHLDSTLGSSLSFRYMALIMQLCALPAWAITILWLVRRLTSGRFHCTRMLE
jgi:hypothetical protein